MQSLRSHAGPYGGADLRFFAQTRLHRRDHGYGSTCIASCACTPQLSPVLELHWLVRAAYGCEQPAKRRCAAAPWRESNSRTLDRDSDGKKVSPYSITERRVPELISVLGSQPAGDVSHRPGGRLSLLSARPAVTPATLNRAATNFATW